MTSRVLDGLRVIEGSAFVAAPLGGMTLAQNGADVIRFDQIGGGLDATRWPLADSGASLFWAGLNKGKRSVQVDLRAPAGRDLVRSLIQASDGLITNFPARGWLDYDHLAAQHERLIMVSLTGNPDGSSEIDYTVQPATGFPWVTGPRDSAAPTNSVLPAWDIAMGTLAAFAFLAADRDRSRTGLGQLVRVALSDVAFAMVGNLGRIADAQLSGPVQVKDGNSLYGAFGTDFETKDGRRVMVVALTARQWRALLDATGSHEISEAIERLTEHDLATEAGRYAVREILAGLLRPWFAARGLAEIREVFAHHDVSWGPYQTFGQLMREDPRCSRDNPLFEEVAQPGVGSYLTPGSPVWFDGAPREPVRPAPVLGQHTEEVLSDVLGLSGKEIGRLFDQGTVA